MSDDDRKPLSVSNNRSVVLRIDLATQKAGARWLGRSITAGVAIGVYQLFRTLLGW